MYEEKYIMVSMIIQGPKQPGNDIDIYFQLLVNELKELWAKPDVRCYDAFKKEVLQPSCRGFTHNSTYACIRQHIGAENKGESGMCDMHG